VIAGTHAELPVLLSSLALDRQLFLLEDALLSPTEPVTGTALSLTFKSFFYDMKKSVAREEWPSKRWVKRSEVFAEHMCPPEKLPSL
jgi:hypothetical protein